MPNERATARPWSCDPADYDLYVWGPNGEMICMMRGTGAGLDQRANAELIVSAVNALDKVRALMKRWCETSKVMSTSTDWPALAKQCAAHADELAQALGEGGTQG